MILVLLAALFVAGGAGFYVMQGLRPLAAGGGGSRSRRRKVLVAVYVPAHDMPAGTIIHPDALSRIRRSPKRPSPNRWIVADAAAAQTFLIGSVARQTLPEGVPIARSATVQPGDRGFLAAVLPKGKRAVTIPVAESPASTGWRCPATGWT